MCSCHFALALFACHSAAVRLQWDDETPYVEHTPAEIDAIVARAERMENALDTVADDEHLFQHAFEEQAPRAIAAAITKEGESGASDGGSRTASPRSSGSTAKDTKDMQKDIENEVMHLVNDPIEEADARKKHVSDEVLVALAPAAAATGDMPLDQLQKEEKFHNRQVAAFTDRYVDR
eukprot:TRINITY_DN29774_c0_g1_i1.p2 TRINITY_DN29774_c0_g1~~TRINITY_DN29774_c0_g1_i1.p2  ORF type:complete len:178 (-),score=44.62 TRINITY_DN29774_c0_g1_i1:147-680(-)